MRFAAGNPKSSRQKFYALAHAADAQAPFVIGAVPIQSNSIIGQFQRYAIGRGSDVDRDLGSARVLGYIAQALLDQPEAT
jgi:hypothetical protein